jgi:hypothetical protein
MSKLFVNDENIFIHKLKVLQFKLSLTKLLGIDSTKIYLLFSSILFK